jgi:hypothetical protein
MAGNPPRGTTKCGPFRDVKTSRDIIGLAVMLYVRFPILHWDVEGIL